MKILMFAGGTGTRLWPISRRAKPKQFQKIIGTKTFIQNTFDTIANGFNPANIYISTTETFAQLLKEQIPNLPENNLILEPAARDTFACVGFAYYTLYKLFPDETIVTLWSDYTFKHPGKLIETLKKADEYAKKSGKVVKIDVNPSYPDTNLGYIEIGEQIDTFKEKEVFEFVKQVEKPNEKDAKEFLETRHYLWHTGINVWPKGKLLELYKKYAPEVVDIFDKIDKGQKELYETIPKMSVDYGIFQKTDSSDFVEMPTDLGWRDVGTWSSVFDELSTQEDENISNTQNYLLESKRNILISSEKKKICAIGINDLAMIETDDVIYISSIKDTNRLKELITLLEKKDPKIL